MLDKYLYDFCTRCNGTGEVTTKYSWMSGTCPVCVGTGREPNEYGKAVLELVKKYGRL